MAQHEARHNTLRVNQGHYIEEQDHLGQPYLGTGANWTRGVPQGSASNNNGTSVLQNYGGLVDYVKITNIHACNINTCANDMRASRKPSFNSLSGSGTLSRQFQYYAQYNLPSRVFFRYAGTLLVITPIILPYIFDNMRG